MRQILTIMSVICLTSSLVTSNEISGIVVFSDSMSDVGDIFSIKGTPPSPPYAEGRFSNGPVWVEVLADHLSVASPTASSTGGTNYAYGGGSAGTTEFAVENKNIDIQVAEYLQVNTPQPKQLFALWGGGNDFNYYLFNPGKPDALLVAETMSGHVAQLADAGARNFLILNLSRRFGSLRYDNDAVVFNQVLAHNLETIRAAHPAVSITELDYFALFDAVSADLTSFGFSNFSVSACLDCGVGGVPSPVAVSDTPDAHYFWDDAHLSAAAHQLVGDAAFNVLATRDGDYDRNGRLTAKDL